MEFQVICDRKRAFKIVRKSLFHVDSYKEIDKYLKKGLPERLLVKSEDTFKVKE